MQISIKNFSMAEFLKWLDENKEDVNTTTLNQVGCLGLCNVSFKNENTEILSTCKTMGVKEAHEKACELFDIDKNRKITEMNIIISCNDIPRITTTELKTD